MLKTGHAIAASSGGCRRPAVQLPIDPARVLDRQVISGEVAAGLVVAPGRNLHIGLPFRRAQHAGQKSSGCHSTDGFARFLPRSSFQVAGSSTNKFPMPSKVS